MKKCLVVMTATLALVGASLAYAAPVELSNAQLDTVSAGAGVFDFVFGEGFTAAGDPVVAAVSTNAADNGSVAGNDNTVVPINVSDNALAITDVDDGGALATDSGTAIGADDNDGSALAQGAGNLALEDTDDSSFATGDGSLALANTDDNAVATEGSIAFADTDDTAIATGAGSASFADTDDNAAAMGAGSVALADTDDPAVAMAPGSIALADTNDNTFAIGEGSVALTDNDDSIIAAGTGNIAQEIDFDDNEIEEGGMGQIAYEACATNSFNKNEVDIDVDVDIDDSFNVETYTLDISGQSGVTAIVLANTLGDQAIGVNLNIANASSTVPTAQTGPTVEPITSLDGNALALTILNQTVINNSVFVGIGLGIVPTDGIDNQV